MAGRTGSGEGEDHRYESVVRADALLGLERLNLLVRAERGCLVLEEHEHAPLWRDLGFEVLKAVTEAGGHCNFFLRATGGR